ncbi:MAG: chitobiase/beta-hexosaminidase C-terminal domain-containing protein [Bacteroides sp.]|nr:chitobiase/beta-hexosaminidase C-terminal domain-containing protein [Eubacterium sp.]MCM1419723.1 chitobiase/beta-hexosaminidase C-terminal domain-containing protein [Roseburia sp.]MCM1463317.1 chitobiase/beta-hexosaminidase C-terminal domain-containing protein [Bacteroides sp.]
MKKLKFTRLLSLLLSLAVMTAAFTGFAVPTAAKSKWDGYTKIASADDLVEMNKSSGKFYLTKDIDLKGVKWDEAIRFSGTLDGNGYAVKNLTSESYGLFHSLTGATVKNLGLLNVSIRADKNSVGALTNGAKNSTIENCYVTGSVSSEKGHAGGLVGLDSSTVKGGNTMKNCVNLADVSSGKYSAFGIIKSVAGDTLTRCINYGRITGISAAGGLCDRAETELTACYNLGEVSAAKAKDVGGIACYVVGTAKDCATATDTAFASKSAKSKATADVNISKKSFQKADRYTGFDFGETWTINAKINGGCPVLTTMLKNYNGSRPTADTPAGTYEKGVTLTLSTTLENGVIRYTTNGKAPTAGSPEYTAPIALNKSATVSAAVFVNGVRAKVLTLKYTIK